MSDPSAQHDPVRSLSGQDAVFVYAETTSMLMHTMGTMILDPREVPGPFGFEQIEQTIASRIHHLPPFRQRLLEVPLDLGNPMLVDDPEFRLENHLHHIAVPAPGTLRELAAIVGDIAGRALDRSQPLWEMWVVEGLADDRIALVTKMHHCMIDGASGASQMAQLLDLEPNANASPPKEEWNPDPLPTSFELARRGFGSRFVSPFSLGRLTFQTLKGLRSRRKAQREIARGGKIEPLLFESAPPTSLNRAITAHRAVAYGHAPLADIKEIKNAFGVTVNDAVLAAATLAIRRYLEARDELPEVPLVCMVPVSLKSDQEKSEFSNKVSTMLVKLPTHLKNPAELIEAVGREASDSKTVFAAIEDNLIPQWLELTPPQLARTGMRLMSDLKLADWQFSPANLVVSNMMGPPLPLYFGRARVEAVFPMGPVGEGFGLNLTLLSNMGRLDVGVLTCREVVPDPWEIADGFADAVAELRLAAQKKLSPAESAQPSATDREAGGALRD